MVQDKFLANIVELRLEDIDLAEWNYKADDEQRFAKLKEKLRRLGQIVNVVVRELPEEERKGEARYEVIDGNHRLLALRELGAKTVWAYNVGAVSRAEAMRIALELNEGDFEPDALKLAPVMAELLEHWDTEELTTTLPYSEEQLQEITKLVEEQWKKEFEELLQYTPARSPEEESGMTIWRVKVENVHLHQLDEWVRRLAEKLDVQRRSHMEVMALRGAVVVELLRRAIEEE